MKMNMKSQVDGYLGSLGAAHAFFESKLLHETDPADLAFDMRQGSGDFVLIDVRKGKDFDDCHIQGAVSIPYASISHARLAEFDRDRLLVVYCWGPACNAATKAAVRLAQLGFRVKELLGGIEYWRREGNAVEGRLGDEAPMVG